MFFWIIRFVWWDWRLYLVSFFEFLRVYTQVDFEGAECLRFFNLIRLIDWPKWVKFSWFQVPAGSHRIGVIFQSTIFHQSFHHGHISCYEFSFEVFGFPFLCLCIVLIFLGISCEFFYFLPWVEVSLYLWVHHSS